jgi:16S rRNA (cytidine1402-2'-O)-methyltransferase
VGTLFLVATPIGNLDDLSGRAVAILRRADIILCEDTRVSRTLLTRYGIASQPECYHDFNKEKLQPRLIERLLAGESIALISDAGTPGIADPGFNLVRAAIAAGITVTPVPGPCALIAALVASGLPTDRFIFENFLPKKDAAARTLLASFATEHRTVIFYEAPYRIVKVLAAMHDIFGDTLVVIGRELTKAYEEFLRGTPRELLAKFAEKPPRGEMAVLFNPRVRVDNVPQETTGT